jgi:hypothetical protein
MGIQELRPFLFVTDMDPLQLPIAPHRIDHLIQTISDDPVDALDPRLYQMFYKDITDGLTLVSLLLSCYPARSQGYLLKTSFCSNFQPILLKDVLSQRLSVAVAQAHHS